MKHLIETANPSGLATVPYDRIILDSTTNSLISRGGVTYEYVDLGLSVKWATMNVGATSEAVCGDYFMWGSTSPNTNTLCDWKHAPFNDGLTEYDEEYFNSLKATVCPNGVLAKEYDAAAQIMGDNWRMPTHDEYLELINNTTKRFAQVNGVNGYNFISNSDTSKYIFIPMAGYRDNDTTLNIGYSGLVWSSSLITSSPDSAYNFDFIAGSYNIRSNYRATGLPVRGVCN